MLLDVRNVTKYFKDEKILDGLSFKIYRKDRIGLIGANGSGKSTLLKMIMKQISSDAGDIKSYGKIGYLPQDLTIIEDITVEDFLKDDENNGELIRILNIFKLSDLYEQKISRLSGGEKTRLYLTKLMVANPDLLILDEPTNHLDHDGLIYLENFISSFDGGVLLVSHDRYFLDQTATKIMVLDKQKISEYSGNYSFYKEAKDKEIQRQEIEYEKYMKKKKQLEEAARKQMERANRYNNMSQNDFYRGKAAKIARASRAIISRSNQLEEVKRPDKLKTINLSFNDSNQKSSNILIRAEKLSKSFEKRLFNNVNFDILKGGRIGIIGKNGVGKSTLLKGIIGEEELEGELYISPSTKIGYFSQELTNLENNSSILEELKNLNKDESYVRTLLGCMLFTEDDVFKQIKDLSLGEKVRVIFLKLILGNYNLLILDEPTNFLDISSREKIEEVLLDYEGAILFVSHDRYFIQKLAKEIWYMDNGGLTRYLGDYQYYLAKQNKKENANKKEEISYEEEILMLEMELSNLSFKLLNCKETEKEQLEARYSELSSRLKMLKKLSFK